MYSRKTTRSTNIVKNMLRWLRMQIIWLRLWERCGEQMSFEGSSEWMQSWSVITSTINQNTETFVFSSFVLSDSRQISVFGRLSSSAFVSWRHTRDHLWSFDAPPHSSIYIKDFWAIPFLSRIGLVYLWMSPVWHTACWPMAINNVSMAGVVNVAGLWPTCRLVYSHPAWSM